MYYKNIGNIVFGKSEGARVSDANNADIGVTTITQNDQNTPFNFWGTLITTGRNGYRQQLAFPWAKAEKNLKYRCEDGGTWGDWVTFVANSDITVQVVKVSVSNGQGTLDLSRLGINGGRSIPVLYNVPVGMSWNGTTVAIQNNLLIVSNTHTESGEVSVRIFSFNFLI